MIEEAEKAASAKASLMNSKKGPVALWGNEPLGKRALSNYFQLVTHHRPVQLLLLLWLMLAIPPCIVAVAQLKNLEEGPGGRHGQGRQGVLSLLVSACQEHSPQACAAGGASLPSASRFATAWVLLPMGQRPKLAVRIRNVSCHTAGERQSCWTSS